MYYYRKINISESHLLKIMVSVKKYRSKINMKIKFMIQ